MARFRSWREGREKERSWDGAVVRGREQTGVLRRVGGVVTLRDLEFSKEQEKQDLALEGMQNFQAVTDIFSTAG